MGCLDYMYNCFKSLKNSFKDYQVHASGYDTQQYVRHGNDSELKLNYYPPVVTSSIPKERLETLMLSLAEFSL